MSIVLVLIGLSIATIERPELGILGMLAVTSTIIYEKDLPLVPLPVMGLHLHVSDLIVVGLLGLVVLRWLTEGDFEIVGTPLNGPLLVFYVVALIATALSFVQATVIDFAFREVWVVTYYLMFFVVTHLIRREDQLQLLLKGVNSLALIVAVVMIVQFALGQSVSILAGRVEALQTDYTVYEEITRIIPPGQSLVLVAFITTAVTLVVTAPEQIRLWDLFRWAILGIAVMFTFNRGYWAASAGAFFMLVFIVNGRERKRLLVGGFSVLAVILLVMLLVQTLSPDSRIANLLNAATARLATLTRRDTFEERSVRYRTFEWEYALSQIEDHPVFGLGLGSKYRPLDTRLDSKQFDGRRYIHNGHFYVIVKTGLLGYLWLTALSVLFFALGLIHWRKIQDGRLRGTYLGFVLAYTAASIAAASSPVHMEWFWTPVIGVMMGINMVILRFALAENDGATNFDRGVGI
jgi:O-antigen ligase